MQFKKFALVALVIPAVMMFAGCGQIAEKATEKAVENATGVKVDKNGESIKIKTDKGEAEFGGSDHEIPDGFPKEFPVYDGAQVSGSMKAEAEGKTSFTVTFETNDSKAEVLSFYKEALPKSGYTISATMDLGDAATISIKKGSVDAGSVSIAKSDGKTSILVGLQQ